MIPTSEEFLKQFNIDNGNVDKLYYDGYIKKFAREFAKLCVEDALKEASKKATLEDDKECDFDGIYVNKDSILKAYPLTNIK